jgi:pimeloyl-ACP methyl ester carboxylesterase
MSRPTLVLIPGLLCDAAVWAQQSQALEASAQAVIVDHGLIDSIEAMAKAILAMPLPTRISVAGHSMGGRVALEVFRQAPARVERLALLDTGFQARPSGEAGQLERAKREALIDCAREQGMRAMGAQWARSMVRADAPPSIHASILDMIARSSVEQFKAQVEALLNRPDATDLLRDIACPVLLACGRDDEWSPLARHVDMQQAIAGSRLEIIEQSGHMTTMEQPEAVCAALANWLQWPARR